MPKTQQCRCKRRWHTLWQRLKEGARVAYEDSYFAELFFPGAVSDPEEQQDLFATPMEEETETKSVSDLFGSSSSPLQSVNDSHPESQMHQFESHQRTSQIAATGSQDMSRQETGSAAQPTTQQNLVTTTENVSPTAPQPGPDIVSYAHQDMVSLRLGVFFQVTQAYKCFMRRLRRQRSTDSTVRLLLWPHHLLASFQITRIILLNFDRAIKNFLLMIQFLLVP